MTTQATSLSRAQAAEVLSTPTWSLHTVLMVASLVIVVLLSALGVVYVKDLHRRLFIDYQTQQALQQQQHFDWGRLLIEQSTWSTQARVQAVAQKHLGMRVPAAKNVVIIKIQ